MMPFALPTLALLTLAATGPGAPADAPPPDRRASLAAFCEHSALAAAIRTRAARLGRPEQAAIFCPCYAREIVANLDERAFQAMVEGRSMPNQADLDDASRNAARLQSENRITPAVIALACIGDALN